MDAKTLNRKKNEEYSKFLDVTNRKPAIFRDIIIESECECVTIEKEILSHSSPINHDR